MPVQAFVDENKERGLTVVAALVDVKDVAECRRALRQLVLPGQRRIHFAKESNPRRRAVLSAICRLPVRADVYRVSPSVSGHRARAAALRAIVDDLSTGSGNRLTIEQDDSLAHADRRVLFDAVRTAGNHEHLLYHLCRPHTEPLLWVPDAVAWSLSRGGEWTERVQPVLRAVKRL